MMQRLRHFLADNQIMLVLAALVAGIVYPSAFVPLAPYTTPMLMVIFFTSSIRLEMDELIGYAKDWKMLVVSNLIMLILLPLAMWIPLAWFAPDWALAFLIVGAMPTGLTIALVADLFGGKASLAMLVSTTTSLLAPLTVPLVLSWLVGQTVAIPTLDLFGSLFLTIVVPFVLAAAVKKEFRSFVQKNDLLWRETSLILFALLVAAITAGSVRGEPITLGWNELGIVIVMTAFMGGIAWFAFATTAWRSPAERITIALCMVYMNNTLALYVGDRFFREQHVVPKLLIILTAVNALLPPIKWAASRLIKTPTAVPGTKRVASPVI